jgi:hypothetical protein
MNNQAKIYKIFKTNSFASLHTEIDLLKLRVVIVLSPSVLFTMINGDNISKKANDI